MTITRQSVLTGRTATQEIDVTQEQIDARRGGLLLQRAMPELTPDEREFIMSGITKDEWDTVFGRQAE